jgi:hypothetical protein
MPARSAEASTKECRCPERIVGSTRKIDPSSSRRVGAMTALLPDEEAALLEVFADDGFADGRQS